MFQSFVLSVFTEGGGGGIVYGWCWLWIIRRSVFYLGKVTTLPCLLDAWLNIETIADMGPGRKGVEMISRIKVTIIKTCNQAAGHPRCMVFLHLIDQNSHIIELFFIHKRIINKPRKMYLSWVCLRYWSFELPDHSCLFLFWI